MFVFGEILSFETEDVDISPDSPVFVLFRISGNTKNESTIPTKGIKVKQENTAKAVFLINRPFTQIQGSRMLLQLVQYTGTEKQKLIGYGFCDLDIDKGRYSRTVRIPLWHPRSKHFIRNEVCGVISPLSDINVVELPQHVDRKTVQTTAVIGEIVINIQKTGYN